MMRFDDSDNDDDDANDNDDDVRDDDVDNNHDDDTMVTFLVEVDNHNEVDES